MHSLMQRTHTTRGSHREADILRLPPPGLVPQVAVGATGADRPAVPVGVAASPAERGRKLCKAVFAGSRLRSLVRRVDLIANYA